MSELSRYFERDEIRPGMFQQELSLRDIAYLANGSYQRIVDAWQGGDINFPHALLTASFFSYITAAGDWRVHPTRDPDVWFSIAAPYANINNPVRASLNAFTRSGNTLTSINNNYNAYIQFGGHFLKLAFLLKGGFVPPGGVVAFPVASQGVTLNGLNLQVAGRTIMQLSAPVVYDNANPLDVRPINASIRTIRGGNYIVYVLPDLAGMSQPVIDPTLTLQPDAAEGMDTIIASALPTTNSETHVNVAIGEFNGSPNYIWRELIKFDLTSLPSAALISSATLSLYALVDYSDNARTFRVFRQKRAWVESQATWNIWSTGNNWDTAGGFGANDCEQTDIGSRAMTATETLNAWKDWVLTPTTKAGLDLGNGWLMKADTELNDAYLFASSDNATAANRPKLIIVYTVGGYPPIWQGSGVIGSSMIRGAA